MHTSTRLICCFTLLTTLAVSAQTDVILKTTSATPGIGESLTREADHAVRRGTDWLLAQQQPDGHWSNPEYPALTALPLWALAKSGCTDTQAIEKATQCLLSYVHDDGSIWRETTDGRKGGGLPNYNTAICMVALRMLNRPDLAPVILKARDYMAKNQYVSGHDSYYGGFGYDPDSKRPYTDLSNSYLAFEAMKLTEDVEDLRPEGEPKTDMDWEAAQVFLQNCQNLPTVNSNAWVNDDPEEVGGFVYHPEQTRAGTTSSEDGAVRFRSMPGMSYAGLLSYIYADVDRNDPRVKATVHWIRNNWSVDAATRDPEKVGTPEEREGLFYMYNVMSKGMAACGVDVLTPYEKPAFNWRVTLIEKMLSLQKTEPDGTGYWLNDVGRYFESDPILVTAYAILSIEYALPE